MKSVNIDLLGYRLANQLYAGSRTLVYQAIREADQYPVVLKLLREEYPTFGELVRFRNQYAIALNLALENVVKPLALLRYRQGYALVMEDVGSISLANYLKQLAADGDHLTFLSIADFLLIGLQLAQTLFEVHRHRVIHKDIKPDNILIEPQTKLVKLIDFSISSLLPRETQEIQNPNVIEGTLAYLSPEQTGRMNRGIDYRSDFYALGVTFYELLTGQLPFTTDDPMELIHCHIARTAVPVAQVNPSVPIMVSDIVSKLMAKNAEERYQSALGLKHDLECCLLAWKATGDLPPFALAQQDRCDRFNIPERLYGREVEVQTLLAAFERVSNGAAELMLVAGFSGIGKTAVVNEVHKPIVRQRGYFIKGKYDQFNRNIPLSAFVQALRDLMAQLLCESDAQLAQWRANIKAALEENAQVIVDVIPELEQIVGPQPPVTELSGGAVQNRFNLLFQKFIQVFATKDHPLVIFLDDLQWADLASLNVMQVLMSQSEVGYVLLIGAYRDNEVSPAHPLMLTLEELRKVSATLNTMTLAPLSPESLNVLVADTLQCSQAIAQPLTQLVEQKTRGNPFFSTQFLKALHEDGWIEFDVPAGHWQCDITKVRSLSLTDDVVEFMGLQLQKLPEATQDILKLAACIGNQFDLATLAIVSEQSEVETAAVLWKALQEGLILPTSEIYKFYQQESLVIDRWSLENSEQRTNDKEQLTVSYKFLHDRVQQAAYALIPEHQKQAVHLKIGQLLLTRRLSAESEDHIFDILNHLAVGIDADPSAIPVVQLAELALLAGMKAKLSIAYQAAIGYFTFGLNRLPQEAWNTHHRLMVDLHREKAECAYLVGQFEESESLLDYTLKHVKDPLDAARIYGILMTQRMTQGTNMLSSVEAGIKGLAILGMTLPTDADALQFLVDEEMPQVREASDRMSAQALLDLPPMTDPVHQSCMKLLSILFSAAYLAGNQTLCLLTNLLMVNISLKHGRAESSSFAYSSYGMMLSHQGNYRKAYQFGKVALDLDRAFNNTQFIAKNNNHFAHGINPYIRPLAENLPLYQQSLELCIELGDLVFGVWTIVFLIWTHLLKGSPLPLVQEEIQKYLSYVQQVNDQNMLYVFQLQQQLVQELMDDAAENGVLTHTGLIENPFFKLWQQSHFDHAINWYGFLVLQRVYLKGDYAQALEVSQTLQATLPANMSFFPIIVYHVYYPLSLAAVYGDTDATTQAVYWQQMQEQQQLLQKWSETCPDNFLHKYQLISAEMARLSGDRLEAVNLYDSAIAIAKENDHIQEEALANELAARFYLDWGKDKVAAAYLQEAYYGYARWGAKAKIADLETRYPQLLQPILNQPKHGFNPLDTLASLSHSSSQSSTQVSSSSNILGDAFDLASVLKAAQAISSSIQLEELIRSLNQIGLENAGAETCVLLLPSNEQWHIRAVTRLEADSASPITHLQTTPLESSTIVPVRLIQYVRRTQAPIIIHNCKTDISGVMDEYMLGHQPQSVLCTPILNQGKLVGILYLEHRSTKGVFTQDRLLVTTFLCTQAAISLENARLYQESQTYAQQLEKSLTELQASEARFQALADNIPGMVYRFQLAADGSTSTPYVSSGCYDLYEVTPESFMTGMDSLNAMNHPDERAPLDRATADSAQTLTPFEHEWRIVTPSGNVKWVQGVSRPQLYPNGSTIWDGVLIDISDRKQAEIQLHQKAEELENALQELQQTQLQLIQSEKMSALGNLVAGVAHEINNPVGFISGNLNEAQQTMQDLVEHLNLYRTQASATDITDHAEEIDLEYIIEDLPKMIDSMKLGCDRIKSISTSLRTFSRADRNHQVTANLHEGIDSTILILKHRLKANESRPAIKVVTDYGNIPTIECFPGQLNQVFMNILANAIDALEEANQKRSFADIKANPNRIEIQTQLDDKRKQVMIHLRDNGVGMSEEVKQRVFDHLFTTKAVGKGTGLGLAIAHQIVTEQHGGTISVTSSPGNGTEFLITLPIKAVSVAKKQDALEQSSKQSSSNFILSKTSGGLRP